MKLERLTSSLEQMNAVSKGLNASIGKLNSSMLVIEELIAELNLGVEAWIEMPIVGPNDRSTFFGYVKHEGKWGLYLHSQRTNGQTMTWTYRGAPRYLKISAVTHLPELLERLCLEAAALDALIEQSVERSRSMIKILEKEKS